MTTNTNLAEYFFSFGGAIFFALLFVVALFGAEVLAWAIRRTARRAGVKRELFSSKEDEGQCPL